MAFRTGQEVVCIDDQSRLGRSHLETDGITRIGSGSVYKVSISTTRDGFAAVHLVGIRRPHGQAYYADRFRPLMRKSTDIGMAILTEILDRETIKDDKPIKVRSL